MLVEVFKSFSFRFYHSSRPSFSCNQFELTFTITHFDGKLFKFIVLFRNLLPYTYNQRIQTFWTIFFFLRPKADIF